MEIRNSNYQGYIWYSDQEIPRVFLDEQLQLNIGDNDNPFIVEGYLVSKELNESHSIRYVDGKYIHKVHDLTSFVGVDYEEDSYYAKRMDKKLLVFRQYWRPAVDENCSGMAVLKPAEKVFVGFKEKEE
jgi:CRISPR type III-associated protein (TIGR04423 family)